MRMFYDCAVKMSESSSVIRKRTGLFIKHSHLKRIEKLRATSIRRFAKSDVIKDHNYNQFFVKKTVENPEAYTSTIELGIEGVQLQSENVSQSDDSWCYGRRVVELSVLADGLKACNITAF